MNKFAQSQVVAYLTLNDCSQEDINFIFAFSMSPIIDFANVPGSTTAIIIINQVLL